jgi:hypothetical protein
MFNGRNIYNMRISILMQHTRCERIFLVSILLLILIISGISCSKDFMTSGKATDESRLSVTGVKTLGNLHMHTTCSDGKNTYEEMVQKALSLNFRFISITDHKFGGSSLCDAVISQCLAEKRLLCIPGMEVTGKVHLLGIGIQSKIDERLSVKKQVEEIHKQGGLAIAAHPFRRGNTYTDEELLETGLDAVECRDIPTNKKKEFYAKLKEHNIPCAYNSDAHNTTRLIQTWNSCDGEIKSIDELKKALKAGRCGER